MTIGFKIKKLREDKNLSQPELANILDISQTKLSNIENNQTKKVDFLFMDKICTFFDKDFQYFADSDKQNNHIENNTKCEIVGFNHGTVNFFPENIVEQMRIIIDENKSQKQQNINLQVEIDILKQQLSEKK